MGALLGYYGFLAAIGIVFMLVLHFHHDRRGYYKTAALVWIGVFVAFGTDGIVTELAPGLQHLLSFSFAIITMYNLGKLTGQLYGFEISLQRIRLYFACAMVTGAFMHFVLGLGFTLVALPLTAALIYPLAFSAYRLIKRWETLDILGRCFVILLTVQAAHLADYPFLRPIASLNTVIFAFSLGTGIAYFTSTLIPLVIAQRHSEEMHAQLEQKVLERTLQLTSAEEKLLHSAKMAALGEMAGGVAHEINTPLATIKSTVSHMADLIESGKIDPAKLARMATNTEKTTDRIAKIVMGLRVFSRDGSKDGFVEVGVLKLVDDTVSLCQERFRNHGVSLIIDNIPDALAIDAREIEISQVLLNLLNNAYDAVEALDDKWVRVTVVEDGDSILFNVTDSGGGIGEEAIAKIFQPFFTTKGVGKGTGMGLSISIGIARSHHGDLKVDPRSVNTRFVLRLPKRQAEPLEQRLA